MPILKPPLEKVIEAKFVKLCKAKGYLTLKQNVVGRRGYPDRLIVRKDGLHVWIELKRVGGVLSENQKTCIEGLHDHNCHVGVFYDADEAMAWVESRR